MGKQSRNCVILHNRKLDACFLFQIRDKNHRNEREFGKIAEQSSVSQEKPVWLGTEKANTTGELGASSQDTLTMVCGH